MSLRALVFIVFVGLASQVLAHDSRPNFIEIIETDPGLFSVQWKVPASVPNAALPTIGMPDTCTTDDLRAMQQAGGAHVGRQNYRCPEGLSGQSININFPILNPSLSTLFQVRLANGEQHVRVLKPDESEWLVPDAENKLSVAGQYTALGIEHIWIGIDHLLFVACLLLIARTARKVLITITGFTDHDHGIHGCALDNTGAGGARRHSDSYTACRGGDCTKRRIPRLGNYQG
jgi:hypothetical protein